jgi:transposase-like protein
VDETYVKVKGQWVYLYRAVDKEGQTVDFYLSEHRDIEAAKAFFRKAILHNGTPQKITLDGYQALHRTVEELQNEAIIPAETILRSCPYLNGSATQVMLPLS